MTSTSIRAGALLLAACSAACSGDVGSVATSTVAPPTTTVPKVPAEPSAQLLRERRVFDDPAPLGAVQEELGVAPVILPPGRWTFGELGIEVTVDTDDFWRLDSAHPGKFVLTRPDAELDVLLPAVLFTRPVGFANPIRAATDSVFPGSSGFDVDDLGEWIDAMPQVAVLDQGRLTLDEREVRWWDVDVDPDLGPTIGCEPGRCVALFWTGATERYTVARDLERIRWYEIEDPAGPIVVFVAARDDEFAQLVADVDELLATAEFGPSAPHPVPDGHAAASSMIIASGRPWTFGGLAGVVIESDTTLHIRQRPGEVEVAVAWFDATVGVARPVQTPPGETIDRAADVVDAVLAAGGRVVDDDATIAGFDAVEIELIADGDDPVPALHLSPPRNGFDRTESGWPRHAHQRAWVFDGPLGPTIIAAGGNDERLLARALDAAPALVEEIAFCEPTDSCLAAR